jgi:predicted transcriptional regulator
MDVLAIKNDLLRLVVATNDAAQLDMVRNYFEIIKSETLPSVEIDEQEKRMIDIGLQQIEEGKVISNAEARQRIQQFL